MKKLLIAAAITVIAVSSQAATIKWSASGVKDITKSTAYSGTYTLYLGSDVIESGSMSNGAISLHNVTFSDDYAGIATTLSYKMTDNAGNIFTSTSKNVIPSTKTTPTIMFAAGGSWVAAPEPTSAMLLLLGVAGLALKRKRA